MSYPASISKYQNESFLVRFQFLNKDPNINYQVQSISSVNAVILLSDGTQSPDDSVFDLSKSFVFSDSIYLWIQGGLSENTYQIYATALMTTGETFTNSVELSVL